MGLGFTVKTRLTPDFFKKLGQRTKAPSAPDTLKFSDITVVALPDEATPEVPNLTSFPDVTNALDGAPLPEASNFLISAKALQPVADGIENRTADPLLRGFLHSVFDDDQMLLTLHPAAEPMVMSYAEVQGIGFLTASLKTSTVGPGFHAYVVSLLEQVAEDCGFIWNWKKNDDETNYQQTGDFLHLENSMLRFLQLLAESLLEFYEKGQHTERLLLNLPVDFPKPCHSYYTMAPLGYFPKAWWENVAEMNLTKDRTQLIEMAEDFFPWWQEGFTSHFYQQLGNVLLWTKVRWRPPANDAEVTTLQQVFAAFEKSQELDSAVHIPEEELSFLQEVALLGPDDQYEAQGEEGTGFLRRTCQTYLTGAWSFDLPGDLFLTNNEEGVVDFWYSGVSGCFSSQHFPVNEKGRYPSPEELFEQVCGIESIGDWRQFIAGGEGVKILIRYQTQQEYDDEYDEHYWHTRAFAAVAGNLAIISFAYEDEDLTAAVEATLATLRHPKQG